MILIVAIILYAKESLLSQSFKGHLIDSYSLVLFLQAKSMIQVRNPTLAPIPHSELSRIVQEEKEEEMRARLHGSFRFKQEATTWPHNSLSRLKENFEHLRATAF